MKQLPKTMRDTIEILRASTNLDEVLGETLKSNYIAMKEIDESDMRNWSEDRRRELFTQLF